MGYDLHIVRTRQWVDADRHPITKDDVDALIAADPELSWSTSDFVEATNPKTGEVIRINSRSYAIQWKGSSVFWWDRRKIICKNPNEPEQMKMIKMADALGAMVVGDEDELYTIRKRLFGRESIASEPWTESSA
jgi:hypothetical protein